MKSANLAVRFLLELCMLAALAYAGWQVGDALAASMVLAIVLPLVAVVVWAVFVAPRATRRAADPWRLLVEAALFGAAAAGLAMTGAGVLAVLLAAAYSVNVSLLFAWRQREH